MNSLPLTPFDILVIIVIGISGIVAWSRGFVTEILSLLAWGGAVFATLYGLPLFQPYVHDYIKPAALADTLLVIVLAIASLVLLKILARFIGDRVRQSHIGALDRALGILFGLLRGLLIVCIGYMLITWVIPRHKQPDWIRDAQSRPLIEYGASILRSLMPESLAQAVGPFGTDEEIQEILQDMQENMPSLPSEQSGGTKDGFYDNNLRDKMDRLLKTI